MHPWSHLNNESHKTASFKPNPIKIRVEIAIIRSYSGKSQLKAQYLIPTKKWTNWLQTKFKMLRRLVFLKYKILREKLRRHDCICRKNRKNLYHVRPSEIVTAETTDQIRLFIRSQWMIFILSIMISHHSNKFAIRSPRILHPAPKA